MTGDCEVCGEYTHDLDCAYNDSTGEELYVCPRCAENLCNGEDNE